MAQDFLHGSTGLVMIQDETTTYGSPEAAWDPSAQCCYVRNLSIKPIIGKVDKKRLHAYHNSPGTIPGKRHCTVEFEIPFPGMPYVDPATGAIALPDFDPILRASGFTTAGPVVRDSASNANTVLYLPTTYRSGAGQASVSLAFVVFEDGADLDVTAVDSGCEVWEANGCVFNLTLHFSADDECYLKFTGMGLYNKPEDAYTWNGDVAIDLTTLTYDAPEDGLVCQGATIDVGGNTDLVASMEVNMNWTVKERTAMNGVGGIAGFMIYRDGSISGSMETHAVLEGTRGRFTDVETAVGRELDFSVMTPQGIGVRVECPNIQLDSPDASRDGVVMYSQPFSARDLDGDTHNSQIGLLFAIPSDIGTDGIEDAAYEIFA